MHRCLLTKSIEWIDHSFSSISIFTSTHRCSLVNIRSIEWIDHISSSISNVTSMHRCSLVNIRSIEWIKNHSSVKIRSISVISCISCISVISFNVFIWITLVVSSILELCLYICGGCMKGGPRVSGVTHAGRSGVVSLVLGADIRDQRVLRVVLCDIVDMLQACRFLLRDLCGRNGEHPAAHRPACCEAPRLLTIQQPSSRHAPPHKAVRSVPVHVLFIARRRARIVCN